MSYAFAETGLETQIELRPFGNDDGLPVFITPRIRELGEDPDAAVAWVRDQQDELDKLLLKAGAVVLRDFAFRSTADFARAIDHYPTVASGYTAGSTPRSTISGKVMEATRVPADLKIPLHQEMTYLPHHPAKLAFFCNQPPATGGFTTLGNARHVLGLAPFELRQEIEHRGVRYVRNFRSPDFEIDDPQFRANHRSWIEAFGTDDRRQIEADCGAMGLEWEWLPDGSLSVAHTARGLIEHPVTGETIWFNQIHMQTVNRKLYTDEVLRSMDTIYGGGRARPYVTTFGDGGILPGDQVEDLLSTIERLEIVFPWQKGDILLIDNLQSYHGRTPFTGERDIQVALLN